MWPGRGSPWCTKRGVAQVCGHRHGAHDLPMLPVNASRCPSSELLDAPTHAACETMRMMTLMTPNC